jgi:uroporphyrinogen decarboxylase
MAGQTPERVPIVCNLVDQGAQELGISLRQYYASGERVAEGQLRLREKYGYDTLMGMFYSALDVELLGCERIVYAKDGPPNVGQLVIRTPGDIHRLQVPADPREHPRFQELARCIGILKREAAGKYPILAPVTASFTLPAMLMGIDAWMHLFLTGEAQQRDLLLAKCSQFCALQIAALREAGADLIVYVNPVASATFITLAQFRQLALPWVLQDLGPAGPAGVVYFNGGGRINPMLADLLATTGIGAYYLNPFDSITEAKGIIAGRGLVAGAINDIRLMDWTPAEIDRQVAQIMEDGKPGGGFIFGTLLMPYAIPEANIRALMAAALRHGRTEKST